MPLDPDMVTDAPAARTPIATSPNTMRFDRPRSSIAAARSRRTPRSNRGPCRHRADRLPPTSQGPTTSHAQKLVADDAFKPRRAIAARGAPPRWSLAPAGEPHSHDRRSQPTSCALHTPPGRAGAGAPAAERRILLCSSSCAVADGTESSPHVGSATSCRGREEVRHSGRMGTRCATRLECDLLGALPRPRSHTCGPGLARTRRTPDLGVLGATARAVSTNRGAR
jgi:hypothetical protein